MISWADAHRRAGVLAAELHADLEIQLDRPIDVFRAVEQLGLVLAFAPLGHVSGMYLPGGLSPGILLHEGHPRTRQRYTAGHELGHHAFGHAAEVDIDLEQALRRADVNKWPDHEKEAEAFGAWFLMPRRLLREGLRQLNIANPASPYDVYALSLWAGTSYTATARQLAVTRLVSTHMANEWASIPPRSIKQSLAGELAPDDLRNDVWNLDRRRSTQSVDARPGDRLVLTLDEIPSSGFSWRFVDLPDHVRLLADSYEDDWEPNPDRAGSATENEFAGGSHPHSFMLEVDPDAPRSVERVELVKAQHWDSASPSDRFELVVSVNPRLHGIQVPEYELALTA